MAIKAQTALLSAESARAATKVITGITAASPPVVSAATHGYVTGDIVFLDNIVGMTQLNKRAYVVTNLSAGTFSLNGIDATGYSAYVSGGDSFKLTMTAIGQVSNVTGFDGEASEIDVTHLRSTAKEFLVGLQDFGNVKLDVFLDNADAGQTLLRTIKAAAAAKGFSLALSDGKVSAFVALVKSFSFSAQKDDAVSGSVSLRVTGEPAWFA